MTVRRLFLWLTVGSTLLLVGLWGFSTVRYFQIEITPLRGGRTLACEFPPGTVRMSLGNWFRNWHEPWSYNYSADPEDLRHRRRVDGGMGKFQIETDTPGGGPRYYIVSFPIWFPYLLLVSGAFGVLKWLERREKDAEGKLAEQL